ncbi:Uncharacterized protein FKW44_024353, partial [Caligus rogercresseyi]
ARPIIRPASNAPGVITRSPRVNGLHLPARTVSAALVYMQKSSQAPQRSFPLSHPGGAASNGSKNSATEGFVVDDHCAGCQGELKDGQALMALDKQYHVWCFKCKACGALLHGEYMGKEGFPYCERDYQTMFGVKCTYCARFISGKVLQAGDNNHFHPTCARCTKCGDPFGDGEEMFLQGAAIWHPQCGPGPEQNGGTIINGFNNNYNSSSSGANRTEFDGMSNASGGHLYNSSRASSPGFRREYDSARFSRPYRGVYNSSSTYSLRRPIEPGDMNMGSSNAHLNHFHLPPSRQGRSSAWIPSPRNPSPPQRTPKPGYTQGRFSAATLPYSRNGCGTLSPDLISQSSFRTADIELRSSSRFAHHPPAPIILNHKTYPYHLIITSNYKMPPEIDRCNLEKHLNDEELDMCSTWGKINSIPCRLGEETI